MAGNIQGITIQIGADTNKLSSAMYAANKSIKETEKDLRSVEKALKIDPTNINLWKDKQDLLNKEIGDTEKKLDALKQAQAQLDADNVDKNSQEYKDLQREINLCETELKGLNDQAKELGSAGAQAVAAMGEQVKEVGGKITGAGEALTTGLTAPIAAVGAASVAAINEVDAGLDIIVTKTGASGEALEEMQTSAKNLATSIPTDFETAGSAIGEVNTRFGLTGQALEDLSGQFIKFAEINGTDVSSSIDDAQASMSAFGIGAEDAGKVLDVLNKAGQDTGVSIDKLSSDLTSNAATMKELGLSYSDSAMFMANLNKNGIDSAAVMGGLRKAYAKAAKDGKTLDEALAEMQDGMKNAASDADATALALELFGNKAGPAIADAIREGRLSFEELGTSLDDYAGNVSDTFDATLDPIDKLKTAMNEAKIIGTDIVEAAAPLIEKGLSALRDVTSQLREKWEALSPEMQETVVKIALVAAAIGPLLVVVGKLVTAVGSIMTMAPQISSAITALTGPLGIAIVAIAAVVTAIATLWNTNEDFRNNIIALWNKLKDSFSKFTEKIQSALEKLGLDFGDTSGSIMDIWTALCDFLAPIFEGALSGIITFLEGAMDSIAGIIEIATGIISGDWATAWQGIVDLAVGIFNTLTAPIQAVLDTIALLFGTDLDSIKQDVSGAFTQIKNDITTLFGQARDKVQEILGNIKNFFTNDLKAAYDTVVDKMGTIKTSIQTKLGEARDKASEILEKIKGFFKDKMESTKTEVQTRIDAIANFFPTKLNEILGNVNDIMSNIKKAFTDKIQQAHDAIKGIIDKIKSLFNISLKLDMKLPHITLKGGEAPYGIGGEGSLPSFSVKWYDKGGIFDHPSIIGVGEKRPEFVGALDDLRQIVREESGAGATDQLLLQMVQLMEQLVEQGSRPITVNQTINANETSYAEQQRAAAYEFKQIARALT